MAAPKGNTNAKRGARWRNALEAALEKEGALEKIAHTVVRLALEGDKDAWQEVANRLDGKHTQSMQIEHTHRDLTDAELESRLADLLGKAGTADAARGENAPGGTTTH